MAANKKIFLLHDGDGIIHTVSEWHYGDYYPKIYYYSSPGYEIVTYRHIYSGKKFEHYERISKRVPKRVDFNG